MRLSTPQNPPVLLIPTSVSLLSLSPPSHLVFALNISDKEVSLSPHNSFSFQTKEQNQTQSRQSLWELTTRSCSCFTTNLGASMTVSLHRLSPLFRVSCTTIFFHHPNFFSLSKNQIQLQHLVRVSQGIYVQQVFII